MPFPKTYKNKKIVIPDLIGNPVLLLDYAMNVLYA